MQTNFSESQLKNKDNKSTEKIFKNVFTVECVMLHVQLMEFWEMN